MKKSPRSNDQLNKVVRNENVSVRRATIDIREMFNECQDFSDRITSIYNQKYWKDYQGNKHQKLRAGKVY